MDDKLWPAIGALIFAGVAAFGISKGRFKTRSANPVNLYVRRRDRPVLFWTYAVLLMVAATLLAYVAVRVA